MGTIAELSRGTKLLLLAGVLLFVDLFLTWQKVALHFGGKAEVTTSLDGWDFWGLLIGLLTLALLALVVAREVGTEALEDTRWEDLAPLVLSSFALVLVLVKSARDADSAWASYVGVILAVGMVLGAFLDSSDAREEPGTVFYAQPVGPSDQPGTRRRDASPDEARPRW